MFRLDGLTSRRGFASAVRKWWLLLGLFALLLCTASLASAQYSDQDEPQHGGVTNWNTNSEYSFELVVDDKNATVHRNGDGGFGRTFHFGRRIRGRNAPFSYE
jgi:hypothetical protein